jgi:hypothetical protein
MTYSGPRTSAIALGVAGLVSLSTLSAAGLRMLLMGSRWLAVRCDPSRNAPCSAASTGSSALKLNAAPRGWIAILSIVGGQNLTRPLLMHAAAKSRVSAGSSQGGISTTLSPCGSICRMSAPGAMTKHPCARQAFSSSLSFRLLDVMFAG